ncbi:hypothetical protein MHYP_G00045440 [Metynnis hypsauchen]
MEQILDVEGKVPRQVSNKKPVTVAEPRKGRLMTGSQFISSQNPRSQAFGSSAQYRSSSLIKVRGAVTGVECGQLNPKTSHGQKHIHHRNHKLNDRQPHIHIPPSGSEVCTLACI